MARTERTGVPGRLITLEGVEGTGKSTLSRLLAEDLTDAGHQVIRTFEPGNSSIGPALRSVLLSPGSLIDPRAEALLFAAERAQHVSEIIRPALERGDLVLCDRYVDSSIAYQGYARGLGVEDVLALSRFATDGLRPWLTIVIDLDPAIGVARKHAAEVNRMEHEALAFHRRVREAFLHLARVPGRDVVVLDGSAALAQVHADALQAVFDRLQALAP